MSDFAKSVDAFLNFMEYRILTGKGSVSRDAAESKAKSEYNIYKQNQKYISDFDKTVSRLNDGKGGTD